MKDEWEKRIRQYRRRLSRQSLLSEVSENLYKNLTEKEIEKQEQAEAASGHIVQAAVASFVLSPVLCSYLLWVLQESLRSGKKRLYFLARDGYQMYLIAKVFCEKLELPLECRYLYCSRYALRAAEYAVRGEAALEYLCLGGIYVTPETVFHRAGIFEEEEMRHTAELLQIEDCKKPLSYTELKELRRKLAASAVFMGQLMRRSEEAYATTIGYLKQEGMLDEVPYALVDSGWSGSIQQSFRYLLKQAGKTGTIEGYYFGLYEYPKEADRSTYHTYYFSPVNGLLRKTTFSNNLFECVCSSPEGMTEGYCFQNGSYMPKLVNRTNPNAARVEAHASCFVQYAKELAERLKGEVPDLKRERRLKNTSERLLSLLMGSPTAEEAGEYGSYVFCDDVIGEENQTLAAALSKADIKANRLFTQIRSRYFRTEEVKAKGSAWLEASAVLAYGKGKGILWHCRVLQWARCFRKQFRAWNVAVRKVM